MAKFRLTHANYHSNEANNLYWSASLIKSFLDCPARTVAELNGEYVRPQSVSLLIGSYVDAAFDKKGSLDAFKAEHPEIFKKDGSLKAEYVKADAIQALITWISCTDHVANHTLFTCLTMH